MILVGIDPGQTSGYVIVNPDEGSVLAQQLSPPMAVAQALAALIYSYWSHWDELTVIVEDFVGSGPRDRNIIDTIELLGYVEHSCAVHGIRCVKQSPQTRRPFVHIAEGRYPRHAERHQKDAYAHVLAFLARERRQLNAKTHPDRSQADRASVSVGSCRSDREACPE